MNATALTPFERALLLLTDAPDYVGVADEAEMLRRGAAADEIREEYARLRFAAEMALRLLDEENCTDPKLLTHCAKCECEVMWPSEHEPLCDECVIEVLHDTLYPEERVPLKNYTVERELAGRTRTQDDEESYS